MSRDDYAARQARQEAIYAKEYRDWIAGMPPTERDRLAKLGLAEPMIPRHGNGAPDRDASESHRCSYAPDIAGAIDEQETAPPAPAADIQKIAMQEAIRILRHFVADILAEGNARLTIECIAIATNLSAYHGDSMTDVARRHGVTRQAVSKRCVDICDRLGLPPSRAMRSKEARAKYRESRFNRLNDIQKI